MDDCCSGKADAIAALARTAAQRRVLIWVMSINGLMFAIELGAGVVARSTALMADSVDMLGDALVYALSLYALRRGAAWEARAALAKGLFIGALGVGIVVELALELAEGTEPSSLLMAVFGTVALAANLLCLRMLWPFRKTNVNMSSTFECSRNDVIANVGVLIAAVGVHAARSPWPDIAVGAILAVLFLRSAMRVIREARAALAANSA